MSTLIVYSSKHGCTESCARELKEKLSNNTTMIAAKEQKKFDWQDFDTILIGGSVYAGMIQSSIQKFCHRHFKELMQKNVGLFVCCMYKNDKAKEQFEKAFSKELRDHAKARGIFGGAINFEKMNVLEKAIIRKVTGVTESISNINHKAIDDFVKALRN